MPVPTTIADLSATAASNSPAGADQVGTSLDDYLRAIQAIIKQESVATIDLSSKTITGTLAQFNTACSDADFASQNGTETLTNKTALAATNTIEARSGPDSSAFSHRNKIINGDFRINQSGYASAAATGADAYGHDMWKMGAAGDSYTFATVNNKTTVTIPAGKVFRQVIEGLNLQTGTYVLSWEGTAQGKIGAGALSASGVTGAIAGGTDTTIEFGPGTVANIQLEAGSVATPFEHRPYGTELALCQRYYEVINGGDLSGGAFTSANLFASVRFATQKRVIPTMTTIVAGSWVGTGVTNLLNSVGFSNGSVYAVQCDATAFSGSVTQGYSYMFRGFDYRASARL